MELQPFCSSIPQRQQVILRAGNLCPDTLQWMNSRQSGTPADLRQQAELLRNHPEEQHVLAIIEKSADLHGWDD
jgi:hypothetical protein